MRAGSGDAVTWSEDKREGSGDVIVRAVGDGQCNIASGSFVIAQVAGGGWREESRRRRCRRACSRQLSALMSPSGRRTTQRERVSYNDAMQRGRATDDDGRQQIEGWGGGDE